MNLAVPHFQALCPLAQRGKDGSIGAGQERLAAELVEDVEQCFAPGLVEMGGDLVEEDDRGLAGDPGDQPRLREDEADEEGLLFAGRAAVGSGVFGGMADEEVGEVGAEERAAGGGVARPFRPEERAIGSSTSAELRPSRSPSRAPASAIAAAGNGESAGPPAMRSCARLTHSQRAAAMATPSSAISCSIASSQAGLGAGSARSLLRPRMAFSKALKRVPWRRSMASTARSRKRRRSEAGPVNSPSIEGVSQMTRRCSRSASEARAGAWLTRTRR